ncbi:MAG TPA: TatD family hydrolase [Pyrinomonadaceae bacterium]|nr:TatD family hydrolase [Pyrinomonadaceae bacterium]
MFIDSHAHIDGPEFDADRNDVIQRARDAGVEVILNVGTGDPHSGAFERAIELGSNHKSIYTAIGTHPHDASKYDQAAEDKIKALISEADHVVAWGEIGLDFHYDNSPREQQLVAFRKQLRAARELELPVIIHTREAEEETVAILREEYRDASAKGVFHCFTGTTQLAERALEVGFMISFSGILTFKKAEDLRETAQRVPLDRLLIETDCPYLSPIPYRGKRNEPAHVVEVAKCLAEMHHLSLKEIADVTSQNFAKLFRISINS